MAAEDSLVTDSTVNVDDVTKNDLYMSPREAQVFDQYNQVYNGQSQQGNSGDGTLNMNDYFPGYEGGGHGNYYGSVVGSVPLFGGGGALAPMAMYDARDAAIRRAVLQKQKEVEDFRKAQKTPVSKLTNINDHLTNEYIDYQQNSWDKALKLSGGDPHKATYLLKNDAEYKKKTQSFENMARLGDDIVNKTAQDELDERAGNFTPTPRYKELRSRLYKSLDPTHPEFKNMAGVYRTMQLERDFSHAVDQVTKRAFADEHGYSGVDINDPEFVKVYNSSVKEYSPEQIEGFAQVLNDNFYQGSDYWTPDRVKKDVANMLRGKVKTSKLSVQQNNDSAADDPDLIPSETDESNVVIGNVLQTSKPRTPVLDAKTKKQKVDVNGKPMWNEPDPEYRQGRFSIHDQATFSKPVKTVIALSALGSDLGTGLPKSEGGNVEVEIGSVGNALVYKGLTGDLAKYNNQLVDDDAPLPDAVKKAKTSYESVVPIKYEYKDEEGKTQYGSVWQPLKTVENALRGKKAKNDNALEEIKNKAVTRNTAIQNTKKEPATPAPVKKDWSKYKRN